MHGGESPRGRPCASATFWSQVHVEGDRANLLELAHAFRRAEAANGRMRALKLIPWLCNYSTGCHSPTFSPSVSAQSLAGVFKWISSF